jgi:hypothetical protein
VVLGQIAVPAGTTETTQVRAVLGPIEMPLTRLSRPRGEGHPPERLAVDSASRDPVVTAPAVGGADHVQRMAMLPRGLQG